MRRRLSSPPIISWIFLIALILGILPAPPARAATWVWTGGGLDNNWSSGFNWSTLSAPVNNGTADLIFAGNTRPNPELNAPWSVNSVTFNSTAGVFTLGSPSAQTLTVGAGGITNNDGDPQFINHSIALSAPQTWGGAGATLLITGPLIHTNGHTLTVDGASFVAISSSIQGSGGLTKNGSATLTLAGSTNNTYVGPTVVNAGTLVVTKMGTAIGIVGDLIVGDGIGGFTADVVTLQGSNPVVSTTNITVNSSGILNVSASAAVLSMGGLTVNGGVVSIINGLDLLPASLNMTGGIINANGSLFLQSSVVTNASNETAQINGKMQLSSLRSFFVADGSADIDIDIPAAIMNGGINKQGQGTMRLAGTNSTGNLMQLTGGTLILASDGALGTGFFIIAGGTLKTEGAPRTINSGTATDSFTVDTPFNLTFNFPFNANGTITKNGPADLILNQPANIGGAFFINNGTVRINANFSATSFVNNAGNIILGSNSFTANNTLTNMGTISFENGTIAGSGNVVNQSIISGYGAFSGTGGLFNNVLLTQGAGNIVYSRTGVFTNNGLIQLALGRQLQLQGGPTVDNFAAIQLNGAGVIGIGNIINRAGGFITGPGFIGVPIANSGTIDPGIGTLLLGPAWTNEGTLQLASNSANLIGGAITNNRLIHGFGTIGTPITNNATINPTGGSLRVNGVANAAAGIIRVPTGAAFVNTGGNLTNSGLISLTGGTFDNLSFLLLNDAQITGFGTLATGGLTNNGIINFTGGVSTINGNVTNNTTKTINVQFNPAIFTGNIVNNGIIKITDTTVTFAGTYTGNAYLSDPATNIFQNNVTIIPGGLMSGSVGDEFHFTGGIVTNSGTFQNGGLLASHVQIINTGTFAQTGPQQWAGNTNFTNTGTASFGTDAGSAASSPLSLTINAGSVQFNAHQHLRALTLAHTGPAYAGSLDLTTKKLFLATTSLADKRVKILELAAAIQANAITSSTAVNPANYDVGLFDNALLQSPGENPSALILSLARLGDTNLDNIVDINDLGNLANNWQQSGQTWSRGDFNLDGFVDINDLGILASNWQQTSAFPLQSAIRNWQSAIPTNIPEPASIAILAITPLLLRRRGRFFR